MELSASNIKSYIQANHPDIAKEIAQNLSSIDCTDTLIGRIIRSANMPYTWQSHVIIIASVLLLCSPETMHAGARVRNGVAKAISDNIGISQPAVSQKIDRAKHYYNHVSWCRDAVDIIVKEVRDVCGS